MATAQQLAASLSAVAAARGSNPRLVVLSLGAGVQSATLSLMAACGAFDARPDVAVWADTGWERPETVAMVEWIAANVPWPVLRATAKHRDGSEANLRDDLSAALNSTGQAFLTAPVFTVDTVDGGRGMGKRQCTREYKVDPILRSIRELLGVGPKRKFPKGWEVETWTGLSVDEYWRLKERRIAWERQRQPLMELGMTRRDCRQWWADNAPAGAPPLGRSSCIGCPYHSAGYWVVLQDELPEAVAEAAAVEESMDRRYKASKGSGHIDNFLHRRRVPLLDAIEADRAAGVTYDPDSDDSFMEECDGMCDL